MSRRDQIKMSDEEAAAFLDEQRIVVVATNGRDGWPHLMPLWYVVRDGELWSWTYAKSQKVRNLERDPRATLQVEAGEQYQELRGVMIKAEVVAHRQVEDVAALGREIFVRYTDPPGGALPDEVAAMVDKQATKRVALQFVQRDTATSGRGRGSGIEIDARLHEVFVVREGKIVRMDEFTDRGQALEAAGLSE